MLAADADDARVVNHLDVNHHAVTILNDLIVAVVHHRQHRRSGVAAEAKEATFTQRALLGAIERTFSGASRTSSESLLARRRQLGHLAIGRRHDQRAATLAIYGSDLVCRVEPEHVVTTDAATFRQVLAQIAGLIRRGGE